MADDLIETQVLSYLANLPDRFWRTRTERGLSCQDVASGIGVSPSTLWRLENRHPVTSHTLLSVLRWMIGSPTPLPSNESRIDLDEWAQLELA